MSSSSPPRTHDVRVVDTSLIFSVIALTFGQPFYGSRTVLSLPDSLRDFYRSGLYPAGSSLSIAGIVCIAAPTINASGCGRSTLHSPHRVWVLDLFACLLTDSSHLFLRAIQAWKVDLTLHQGNQIEMYLSIGHCSHLVQTYWLVNVLL